MTDLIQTLKDAIIANAGPLKSAPKNWHKRNCPMCVPRGYSRDTRQRMGIQLGPTTILVNCFNCGYSGAYESGERLTNKFKQFLKQIGIDDKFIKAVEFEIFKTKNRLDSTRDGAVTTRIETLVDRWKQMPLPDGALPITEWLLHGVTDHNFLEVAQYAISRRIFDLDRFYWTPSTDHNLNQRLIIPYHYRGKTVGYTSRLCYDAPDKRIPKYFQQSPTDFVYNLDNQADHNRTHVIVTEGVLDAWAVDGVGILGEMNQNKADLINRLHKTVVVSPDRDQKGRDLVDFALDNGWSVAFPKWDTDIKDAAGAAARYGRLLTTKSILASAVSGKEKIKLKWGITYNELSRRRHK